MRDWITKDFRWKVASLVFAVIIWMTVYNYRTSTPEFGTHTIQNTYGDVPVLVVSSTGNASSFSIAPNKVSVTVSGPDNVMNTLQATEIHPFIDVTSNDSSGTFRATVTVSLPKGVALVNVDPSWIGATPPPPPPPPSPSPSPGH